MLLSLHIENIAVIKCVDFDFTPGFMVLTGETGAGKSIVIDSINLLLGAKAERELIRSGCSTATVNNVMNNRPSSNTPENIRDSSEVRQRYFSSAATVCVS